MFKCKSDEVILIYFLKLNKYIDIDIKMVETAGNINIYPQLNNAMQFRLDEINNIKYYFIAEMHDRETISKMLSKYMAVFNYFNKISLVLSAASGTVSIASFATVSGAPVGIVSASLGLAFSISNSIAKKVLKQ